MSNGTRMSNGHGINGRSHVDSEPKEYEANIHVPGAMLTPSNVEDSQILAAMDRLRELGIDRKYDLPQIIVCGSQSAGKSSVLESLVQVPFPRGEGTCTRYVTKVTMLPAEAPLIEVRIQPGPERPASEAEELSRFHRIAGSRTLAANLGRFMEEAHHLIFPNTRPGPKDPMITKDMMLINVYGPDTRPLQVLDLPGLIAFDQQDSGNETVIEDMVARYMAEKQSIILAVIKANDDLSNQKVLKLCKTHDPKGERTLGVVTRPDVADHKEKESIIAVMQGRDEDFRFQHRWHVVRNRSSQETNTSQAARDRAEALLLDGHPWNTVDKSCRGISELRERLRELLFGVAKKELPGLRDTFRKRLGRLREDLKALGGKELSEGQLEKAVEQSLTRLRDASHDHARGHYESNINNFEYDSAVYLRARVVEKSEVFRDKLVAKGHAWTTLIRREPPDPDSDLGSVYREDGGGVESNVKPKHDNLQQEIEEVVKMLNQTRGQTLPGTFDPRRIGNLFWRMSKGWGAIAREHIELIYVCCENYFNAVAPVAFQRRPGSGPNSLGFSDYKEVAERFVGPHIVPQLEECREKALEELEKLEADREDALLNADLRFLKDWRSHRQDREFRRAMRAHHELEVLAAANGTTRKKDLNLDKTTYAKHAGVHSQQEWTEATADEYLDAMWSHYRIERDIYITNVLRQAVERHFLRHIAEIVPKALGAPEIKKLTREDSVKEAKRQEIAREIDILNQSLSALEKIQ